jgi:hypothetical protein
MGSWFIEVFLRWEWCRPPFSKRGSDQQGPYLPRRRSVAQLDCSNGQAKPTSKHGEDSLDDRQVAVSESMTNKGLMQNRGKEPSDNPSCLKVDFQVLDKSIGGHKEAQRSEQACFNRRDERERSHKFW